MSLESDILPPVILSSETAGAVEGEESHEGHGHAVFNAGILIIFGMLMVYMLFEAYKHKYEIKFGHEASLVCLVGLLISALAWYYEIGQFTDLMTFDDDLFFYFVLPPIVFASGFNMYRNNFFNNIQNVILFGVFSTFVAFTLFSVFTSLAVEGMQFVQYTYDTVHQTW